MATNANTADASVRSHTIMSALDSDILKPDIASNLYRPYGTEWKHFLRLESLGFNTATTNEEYSHFEKDRFHVSLKVSAAAAVASNTQELTLADPAGEGTFYARPKDLLMWTATEGGTPSAIRLLIVSTDKATRKIVVTPQDSTETMPTLAVNAVMAIYSGVSGEGSASVDPASTRFRKFTNNLQIIDEKVATTGTSLTDELWFVIGGTSTGKGAYHDDMADAEGRMLTRIFGTFWFGQKGGDQVDPTSEVDGVQTTTNGVFNEISSYGNDITGFATLADFDQIGANVITNNGNTTDPIWFAQGYGLNKAVNTLLKADNTVNDATYLQKTIDAKLFNPSNSYGAYSNFTYYERNHFHYAFELIENWSNAETYGIFDVENNGVAIPMGKGKDQVSKKSVATMGQRYKANGSLNRKFMTGNLVGFGSNEVGETIVSEVDSRKFMIKANIGNQFMEVANFNGIYM